MAELNIFQSESPKFLNNKYIGNKMTAGEALFAPLRVDRFEIKPSKINKGKECLYAQVYWKDKKTGTYEYRMLITESYSIIEAFKQFGDINKDDNFGFTKIIKKKDGTYRAASITEVEKQNLRDRSF